MSQSHILPIGDTIRSTYIVLRANYGSYTMTDRMRCILKTAAGVGVELGTKPIPTHAGDEVLIRIRATSICGTDVHIYNWDAWSSSRIGTKRLPQIIGHELAGEVIAAGSSCRRVKVGDQVSCETHIYDPSDLTAQLGQRHIGEHMQILGVDRDGAFAEYIAVPERVCWINDPSLTPEIASIQEPLGNATYALLGEDSDVAGKTIAIIGDGPTALFATAVARVCGLTPIFVLGMNEFNLNIARRVGADFTIDVTDESFDWHGFIKDHTKGYGVDVVLEMAGTQKAVNEGFTVLRRGGRFSAFGVSTERETTIDYNDGIVFKGAQIHGISGRKIFDTWYRNSNLLMSGRLDVRPVITHLFDLEDFEAGFRKMVATPREAAKCVLFLDRDERIAAERRMAGFAAEAMPIGAS